MATSITLSGWKEFIDKSLSLDDTVFNEVEGEVLDALQLWEERAKRTAPVDFGTLVGNIGPARITDIMTGELTSGSESSPWNEWGTGDRAIIPPDEADYASQFWTRKKHIGRYPDPFFFIHVPEVQNYLTTNIENNILNREH